MRCNLASFTLNHGKTGQAGGTRQFILGQVEAGTRASERVTVCSDFSC